MILKVMKKQGTPTAIGGSKPRLTVGKRKGSSHITDTQQEETWRGWLTFDLTFDPVDWSMGEEEGETVG